MEKKTYQVIWATNIGLFDYLVIEKKENGFIYFSYGKAFGDDITILEKGLKRRIKTNKVGTEFFVYKNKKHFLQILPKKAILTDFKGA